MRRLLVGHCHYHCQRFCALLQIQTGSEIHLDVNFIGSVRAVLDCVVFCQIFYANGYVSLVVFL